MTRDTYSDWEMGPFSDWHREELPSWYPWTDIDYVGYQSGGGVVYILLELKCLPDAQFDPFKPTEGKPTPRIPRFVEGAQCSSFCRVAYRKLPRI